MNEVEKELNIEEIVSKKYEFTVDMPYNNVTPIKVINLIKILI